MNPTMNQRDDSDAALAERRRAMRGRIARIQDTLLDRAEALANALGENAGTSAATLAHRRRQIANIWQCWRFCALSRCRRAHCCQGEPRHCLELAVPLLPPEKIAEWIAPRSRSGRRK